MDPVWNNFSTADQARMRAALGLQDLPDPDELSPQQLQTLDRVFGYDISVQILVFDAIQDTREKTKGGENAAEPQLPSPDMGDQSDLAAMLATIQEKLGKLQLGTAQEGVKANKLKMQRLSEQRLEKIKESIEKMEKASTAGLWGKIFGWIGVGLAVLGAAIATAVTGGAAAPALAVALVGLTMMILQETGAMDKIVEFLAKNPAFLMVGLALIGGPLGLAAGATLFGLKEGGVLDEDKMKMAIQVTFAAAMLVASIAAMVFSGGSSAMQAAATWVRITTLVAQGVGAAVSVGGGAAGIAQSAYNYEATMAQAESKDFLAWLAKVQAQLEDEQEGLKKAIEALQNDMTVAAEILGSIFKSKDAIIGRMGTA